MQSKDSKDVLFSAQCACVCVCVCILSVYDIVLMCVLNGPLFQ